MVVKNDVDVIRFSITKGDHALKKYCFMPLVMSKRKFWDLVSWLRSSFEMMGLFDNSFGAHLTQAFHVPPALWSGNFVFLSWLIFCLDMRSLLMLKLSYFTDWVWNNGSCMQWLLMWSALAFFEIGSKVFEWRRIFLPFCRCWLCPRM